MSASFNPKQLAHEIALGVGHINATRLKRYTSTDIKTLLNQLTTEQRKIRARQFTDGQTDAIKEKHRHMQNISQAITIITGYAQKHRIAF